MLSFVNFIFSHTAEPLSEQAFWLGLFQPTSKLRTFYTEVTEIKSIWVPTVLLKSDWLQSDYNFQSPFAKLTFSGHLHLALLNTEPRQTLYLQTWSKTSQSFLNCESTISITDSKLTGIASFWFLQAGPLMFLFVGLLLRRNLQKRRKKKHL